MLVSTADFLPLLYNRRHFGVALFFVALAHAFYVTGWYQAYSPVDKYVGVLVGNTNFASFLGFPFEYLGIAALVILFVLAATSHDFWLEFLGAPVWKAIHMSVYAAYGLLVMHVVLGFLQSEHHVIYPLLVTAGLLLVVCLHLAAALKEYRADAASPLHGPSVNDAARSPWIVAARIADLENGRGRAVLLPDGERVALFPLRQPGIGSVECLSTPERTIVGGPGNRRPRHLPLARLSVLPRATGGLQRPSPK